MLFILVLSLVFVNSRSKNFLEAATEILLNFHCNAQPALSKSKCSPFFFLLCKPLQLSSCYCKKVQELYSDSQIRIVWCSILLRHSINFFYPDKQLADRIELTDLSNKLFMYVDAQQLGKLLNEVVCRKRLV